MNAFARARFSITAAAPIQEPKTLSKTEEKDLARKTDEPLAPELLVDDLNPAERIEFERSLEGEKIAAESAVFLDFVSASVGRIIDDAIALGSFDDLAKHTPRLGFYAVLAEDGAPYRFYEAAQNEWVEVVADAAAHAETDNLIKVLSVIVLQSRKAKIAPLLPSYGKYLNGAKAFFTRHKAPLKPFEMLASRESLDAIGRGKMYKGTKFRARCADFLKSFRPYFNEKIRANTGAVSRTQLDTLNALFTLIAKPDSESAFARVSKAITATKDLALIPFFELDDDVTGDKGDLNERLNTIVKKQGSGGNLTTEDRQRLREDDPDTLREFNRIKKNLKTRLDQDIRKAVLKATDNKKDWAFIEDVVPILRKMGYDQKTLTARYGKQLLESKKQIGIDVNTFITSKTGEPSKTTGIRPGAVEIVVNTNWPKPAYIFQMRSQAQIDKGNNDWNRAYTKAHHADSQDKKDQFVMDMITGDKLSSGIKKWRNIMLGGDKKNDAGQKAGMFAHLAEAFYWTAARAGTKDGNTKGERTYGLSSILGQHVRVASATKLIIQYSAKSGQLQKHVLDLSLAQTPNDKAALKNLIDFIVKRKAAAKNGGLIFYAQSSAASAKGEGKRININEFNTWMKRILGDDRFTVHKIRALRGTQIAVPALNEALETYSKRAKKEGASDKLANTVFVEALLPVGKQLGHFFREEPTAMTAISKGYVVTRVMRQWFDKIGRRPNATIEKGLDASKKIENG